MKGGEYIDKTNLEPSWNKVPYSTWEGSCPVGYTLQHDDGSNGGGSPSFITFGGSQTVQAKHDWEDVMAHSYHDDSYRCNLRNTNTNGSD